jgi:hypothetical protein
MRVDPKERWGDVVVACRCAQLGSKGAEVFHGALLPTSSLRFITLQDNLIPPEAMAALRDAAAKVPGLQLNL